MPVCSFSGKTFEKGGKMLVLNSGKVLYFENSKAEKNYLLGRKGREVKWTKTFHDNKAKHASDKAKSADAKAKK